ncbi:MAG: hypothetical protein WDA75_09930 [Candidatus Latescibacterota bacterium]|jgi:hypothetical protein
MMRQAGFATVLTLALLTFGPAARAWARPFRVAQIPNGLVVGCAACHVDPAGGGPRNVFGQQIGTRFLSEPGPFGNVVWGPELAAMDADGDGSTNGEELGDPDGSWKGGDPAPGDPTAVTKPQDADSYPPSVPTAVAQSTWAQVKGLVKELLDR